MKFKNLIYKILGFSNEEIEMMDVIITARKLQTYLWGEHDNGWTLEEWKRMFRKRVKKIDDIDQKKPYYKVELRKRLLQQGALSIALLNSFEVLKDVSNQESALNEYRDKIV